MIRVIARALIECCNPDDFASSRFALRIPLLTAHMWSNTFSEWDEAKRLAACTEMARWDTDELKTHAEEAARTAPEEFRPLLRQILKVIPSCIRVAWRRLTEPGGLRAPVWQHLRRHEDYEFIFPPHLPAYSPGLRPFAEADWELKELLGIGGFGEVWKARIKGWELIPEVVIKFYMPRHEDPRGDQAQRAFRHEAAVMNQLMSNGVCEGIAQLRSTSLEHHPPCLIFEAVDGGNLLQSLLGNMYEQKPLGITTIVRLIRRLARTTGDCHRRQPAIVHRDVKPENILLQSDPLHPHRWSPKLCDFGISGFAGSAPGRGQGGEHAQPASHRLIRRSSLLLGTFTPMYASPQQRKGESPKPTDDIYALGVLFYQLLANDLLSPVPGGIDWTKSLEFRGLTDSQLSFLSHCVSHRSDLRPRDGYVMAGELLRLFPEEFPKTRKATTSANSRKHAGASSSSNPSPPSHGFAPLFRKSAAAAPRPANPSTENDPAASPNRMPKSSTSHNPSSSTSAPTSATNARSAPQSPNPESLTKRRFWPWSAK